MTYKLNQAIEKALQEDDTIKQQNEQIIKLLFDIKEELIKLNEKKCGRKEDDQS